MCQPAGETVLESIGVCRCLRPRRLNETGGATFTYRPNGPEPIKHEGHRPPKESMVPPGTVNAKVDRHAHAKTAVSNKTRPSSPRPLIMRTPAKGRLGTSQEHKGVTRSERRELEATTAVSEPNKRVVVKNKRNKMTIITITRQIDSRLRWPLGHSTLLTAPTATDSAAPRQYLTLDEPSMSTRVDVAGQQHSQKTPEN